MVSPYTLYDVNTRDSHAVGEAVWEIEKQLFGEAARYETTLGWFETVAGMFAGELRYFQKMDTYYHNLEHTLQATLCWARILRGYHLHSRKAMVSHEFFHLGLLAVLLHDIGYLKEEHDEIGTGAKFTFVHERRSCELAQIYLSGLGWETDQIFAVQHIISCTGPRAIIDAIPFRHRAEKLLGQMLCTADYLGQMSDPQYVEKLPVLFLEFEESDDYRGIPPSRRMFPNVEELMRKTPDFWSYAVLPKLDYDCAGVYRYLGIPDPDGANPYLEEVESNLARIRSMRV